MRGIDPKTWTLVSPLLDRALDLSSEERRSLLASVGAERPEVADLVEELLASHDAAIAADFLGEAPPTPEVGLAGTTVGAYVLERPLGSGGMGSVWLARRADGRFEGLAAVKFLNLAVLDREGQRRFRKEGTALARLSHPNIGRLLDAGVTGSGQPYLVLEYVGGVPITRFADDGRLDVPARLRLLLQVADAVAHAHANLVVHRDLKPSNVLVDASGQARLLDFGIAKLLADGDTADDGSTARTVRAFTPAFAAPEQFTNADITVATDVFALGTLLYVLMAGRHPAEPALDSPADLIHAITDGEPPPLSVRAVDPDPRLSSDPAAIAKARSTTPARLRALLTGDLDTIAATALKRRPGERYAAVNALAADVRRHLQHEPIAARADSPSYRLRKFARRQRLPLAAGAVTAVALVVASAGLWVQGRRSAADRDFALQQLARAEAMSDMTSFLLSDAAPQGRPFTAGDLLQRAEALLNRQPADPPDAALVEALVTVGTEFQSQDEDGNARRVLLRAFDLAGRLPVARLSTRAKAGCALSNTLARGDQADLARAQELVTASARLLPQSAPFALDRVYCERMAASVARHAGNGAADVAHAEAARRLLEESQLGSPAAVLGAEIELAEAYRASGQPVRADALYRSAFDRMTALGRDQTEQAGTLLNNWGLTLQALGRPREADTKFSQAVALSQADASGASVSPMLLLNAARPVLELGREGEAIATIERAIAEATRLDDQVVQLQALLLLAGAERQRGDLDRATALFDEAERRLRERLPPGHAAFTSLLVQRAVVATARGRLAEARALTDDALARAQATPQGADLIGAIHQRRATIALADGRHADAVAEATAAVEEERRRSDPAQLSSRLGRLLLTLGEAQSKAGQTASARETLALALRHLEATLGADHRDSRRSHVLMAGLH